MNCISNVVTELLTLWKVSLELYPRKAFRPGGLNMKRCWCTDRNAKVSWCSRTRRTYKYKYLVKIRTSATHTITLLKFYQRSCLISSSLFFDLGWCNYIAVKDNFTEFALLLPFGQATIDKLPQDLGLVLWSSPTKFPVLQLVL